MPQLYTLFIEKTAELVSLVLTEDEAQSLLSGVERLSPALHRRLRLISNKSLGIFNAYAL